MKETINMNVDKELVETVNVIQTLKDCGVISVTNELSCMGNLWNVSSTEKISQQGIK